MDWSMQDPLVALTVMVVSGLVTRALGQSLHRRMSRLCSRCAPAGSRYIEASSGHQGSITQREEP